MYGWKCSQIKWWQFGWINKVKESTSIHKNRYRTVVVIIRALFEDADVDGNGSITFDELQAELEKHPDVIENLTIRYYHNLIVSIMNALFCSAANWLKPQVLKKKKSCLEYFPSWMRWTYIRNNLSLVFFVVLFGSINVVLFIEAAVRHRQKG